MDGSPCATSSHIALIDSEKICFIIHKPKAKVNNDMKLNISSFTIRPIVNNKASLEQYDAISLNFNEEIDNLLGNPAHGDFIMLMPKQRKKTIHE